MLLQEWIGSTSKLVLSAEKSANLSRFGFMGSCTSRIGSISVNYLRTYRKVGWHLLMPNICAVGSTFDYRPEVGFTHQLWDVTIKSGRFGKSFGSWTVSVDYDRNISHVTQRFGVKHWILKFDLNACLAVRCSLSWVVARWVKVDGRGHGKQVWQPEVID